jgi:hypothetical protein
MVAGSIEPFAKFWDMHSWSDRVYDMFAIIADITKYKYGWWLQSPADGEITKIIRVRNALQ